MLYYDPDVWKTNLFPALIFAAAVAAGSDERPRTIGEFMSVDSATGIIAHRGFSGLAPENTLAAVEMAIDAGAHMVEVDVGMTADGQVICLHDETLDRTTNGRGRPSEHRLEAIRRLDAGSWFSKEHAGERVPTLAEVFETAKGRVLVNVEIKPEAVDHGAAAAVVTLVRAHGMADQIVVSSFAPEALRRIKVADPAIATASLFNKKLHAGLDPLEVTTEVGSRGFNIAAGRVTADILDRCHRHGIPVAVYTVNDPDDMRRLVRMGVDAIFTDHPDRLVRVLSERHPPAAQAR